MRLFEAILAANQRQVAGDKTARIAVADHAGALPVAALTCIDARLNHLLPDALGLPEEQFIWLRNAGNIITGPLSSTMRSLALACAVKGAREIAIIGHLDCLVCKTTALTLLDRLSALGVDRHRLPANLVEYFGLFGSERQNVLRAVEHIRSSPLIGSKVPVHGLLIDLKTGRLESVVNGYEPVATTAQPANPIFQKAERTLDAFAQIGDFATNELNLPAAKIGEAVKTAHDWLHKAETVAEMIEDQIGYQAPTAAKPIPPPVPKSAEPPRIARIKDQLRQVMGPPTVVKTPPKSK
ncbi:MAG: hypothetical protein HZA31_03550 [Opitutae bacterium]|nr:hypothetical protein [Opitutae bacterium]